MRIKKHSKIIIVLSTTRFWEPPNMVVASEAVTIVTAVWIVKIVPRLMMKNIKR